MPRPQTKRRKERSEAKTLTGIAIGQVVEASRNVPSPEEADHLGLHVSICSLERRKEKKNNNNKSSGGEMIVF